MSEKAVGYPWLKFYTDLPDNPKLRTLTDAQKWRYVHMYMIAGKADAGGLLIIDDELLDAAALAWYLRIDTDTAQADIKTMLQARLLSTEGNGYAIASFMDEQGSSHAEKRAQWRERQERRRERAKNSTQDKEEEQDKDIDENRQEEEKKREEQNRQEVTPLSRVTNSVVVSSFLSSFSIAEQLVLEQLEGELTEEIAYHFQQALNAYGKPKTYQYLRWTLEEAKHHTWRYAYNMDTGQELIKDWQLEGSSAASVNKRELPPELSDMTPLQMLDYNLAREAERLKSTNEPPEPWYAYVPDGARVEEPKALGLNREVYMGAKLIGHLDSKWRYMALEEEQRPKKKAEVII
jgi:ribosomal protein S25